MKRPKIETGKVYHLMEKSRDGEILFKDAPDHYRFMQSVYEFNDCNCKPTNIRKRVSVYIKLCLPSHVRSECVEIIAFCILPDHYHFLLKQKRDDGIATFMQRLNTSYVMYFNNKYSKKSSPFEGRFRVASIEDDKNLKHVIRYIHLNPFLIYFPSLDLLMENHERAKEILETYRWSSFFDYNGRDNYKNILSGKKIDKCCKNEKDFRRFITNQKKTDKNLLLE